MLKKILNIIGLYCLIFSLLFILPYNNIQPNNTIESSIQSCNELIIPKNNLIEKENNKMLSIGNKEAEQIFVNNKEVEEIYLGSEPNPIYESINYFCVEAVQNTSIRFKASTNPGFIIQYSYNKKDWTDYIFSDYITLNAGEMCYWKGDANRFSFTTRIYFESTGNIKIRGNIMSLIDSTCKSKTIPHDSCFSELFSGCSKLIDISRLKLPATTLTKYCYSSMFYNCTGITFVPANLLPATSLASNCYYAMFSNCTNLINAPELPAENLTLECYYTMFSNCTNLVTGPTSLGSVSIGLRSCNSMFSGCSRLTTAPVLPATNLANESYYGMFRNCTSLTMAPELPATRLYKDCYKQMFMGCSSLNYIKIGYTGELHGYETTDWVNGVSSTGDFYYNGTKIRRGYDSIPINWVIHTF